MTALTRVCWSMISETHVRYGVTTLRHGVAWRQTAEFVSRYFTKGRMAVVEGRLQIRDWTDKEGGKRRSAEVIADNVYFGDSKRDAEASGAYAPPAAGGYAPPPAAPSGGYGAPSGGDQFAGLTGTSCPA